MTNGSAGALAIFLVAAIVGGTAFHLYGGTKYVMSFVSPDKAGDMNKTLNSLVALDQGKLPVQLDADTTLVSETVTGTQLTYAYTISDTIIEPFKQNQGSFKLEIVKKVCASPLGKTIDAGATFSYQYFNKDKSQKVTEFVVTRCSAAT